MAALYFLIAPHASVLNMAELTSLSSTSGNDHRRKPGAGAPKFPPVGCLLLCL